MSIRHWHSSQARHQAGRIPSTWARSILLGVLVALMSLCHSVLIPSAMAGPEREVSAVHSDEGPVHAMECAAGQNLLTPVEKRSDVDHVMSGDMVLLTHLSLAKSTGWDLPAGPSLPPANLRVVFQVFRI